MAAEVVVVVVVAAVVVVVVAWLVAVAGAEVELELDGERLVVAEEDADEHEELALGFAVGVSGTT